MKSCKTKKLPDTKIKNKISKLNAQLFFYLFGLPLFRGHLIMGQYSSMVVYWLSVLRDNSSNRSGGEQIFLLFFELFAVYLELIHDYA